VCGTLLLILLAGCLLNYFSSSHDKAKPADSGTSTTNELLTEQDWHPDDPKSSVSPEEKQNRVTQHIWKMMAPLIHELRAETYFGLIRLLKPGCRSVIILVDSDSKDRLLPTFARNIYNIRKYIYYFQFFFLIKFFQQQNIFLRIPHD
jgi:DnaJ family protein C protein 16